VLELLPGVLTPLGHERLVRLGGWMPFEKAAEVFATFTGIHISPIVSRNYTEQAGAVYEQMQRAEVEALEKHMPPAEAGAEKMQISADGAMVPLRHGVWAEVRTLVIGEVQVQGEQIRTRNLSYFSRKVSAQEFQRLALVEVQRRGIEQARQVAAIMDGADWEQGFTDYHCPQAIRILDFPHAAEHIGAIGACLYGEHTPESQAWLKERLHGLKHEGPEPLLRELSGLQKAHPQLEPIATHLNYLKKRQAQMQYPQFQVQGWPIGSGIVESGNKLVVEARLKGAGMHWAEGNVNPMLAIRNILCSGRWGEDWSRIETGLRQRERQRRAMLHQKRKPPVSVFDLIEATLGEDVPETPRKPSSNPWRNFKHGKALFQRPAPKL